MAWKAEVEKISREISAMFKQFDEQQRRIAVAYLIANLLIDCFDLSLAVGLLERIKHLMLTVPSKRDLDQYLYIS